MKIFVKPKYRRKRDRVNIWVILITDSSTFERSFNEMFSQANKIYFVIHAFDNLLPHGMGCDSHSFTTYNIYKKKAFLND